MFSSGDSIWHTKYSTCSLGGQRFSAFDKDQDPRANDHSAEKYGGGWWFNSCLASHLNGIYIDGGYTMYDYTDIMHGIIWYTWKDYDYSLKGTEMKLRPN